MEDGELVCLVSIFEAGGNEKLGLVMQDYALTNDFTAVENVLSSLDFAKTKASNRKKLAEQALASVGMEELKNKPVKELNNQRMTIVIITHDIEVANLCEIW